LSETLLSVSVHHTGFAGYNIHANPEKKEKFPNELFTLPVKVGLFIVTDLG